MAIGANKLVLNAVNGVSVGRAFSLTKEEHFCHYCLALSKIHTIDQGCAEPDSSLSRDLFRMPHHLAPEHDEVDVRHGGNICDGISGGGNDIGLHSFAERAVLVVDSQIAGWLGSR